MFQQICVTDVQGSKDKCFPLPFFPIVCVCLSSFMFRWGSEVLKCQSRDSNQSIPSPANRKEAGVGLPRERPHEISTLKLQIGRKHFNELQNPNWGWGLKGAPHSALGPASFWSILNTWEVLMTSQDCKTKIHALETESSSSLVTSHLVLDSVSWTWNAPFISTVQVLYGNSVCYTQPQATRYYTHELAV